MIARPEVRVAVPDDDRDTASSVASNLDDRGRLSIAHSSPQAEVEDRAEAQRSSQARTALLGMVSRELRTPLQAMLANIELLAVRSPQDGTVDIIERLMRCIELISGQLDNIAHYTRLANGSMEVRRERFIVLDLLRRIVEEHASAANANHQVITLDAPRGADVTIHGDPIRLHQVINNYLTNAIKCAGPGRISVVVRLLSHQFGDLSVADAVEVIVEDEGPGISDAESAALWEPFVRGDSISRSRRGSGLGLAVVKLLAASVGWDVGVRSETGHGATFYVVLPLIGPDLASPPLPSPAEGS
jgi:signal transduction histidine kinase